ncbi:MAG TPA: hypothetical protein VLD57_01470 [Blastocatellia bacterium]|nr:hypothetical protein [Blastocatellia bacterium]
MPLLLAVAMSACSPGGEPPPGARASQQDGASTTSPQPPAVQQPVAATAQTSQSATTAVVTPQPPSVPPANAPILQVPVTKIDFGKQPKDKTITREIALRNVGKSELKIESVVPS